MQDQDDQRIFQACARLVAARVVQPLALGGEEERHWADCDLASLAELRLALRLEPRGLDPHTRAATWAKASLEPECAPGERDFEQCFWILDRGERAGTVALARQTWGSPRVRLSSLYVFPTHRRRGIALRTLEQFAREIRPLAIKLETCWTWQPTVRFYLTHGFWVRMWKADLDLVWHTGTPPPVVEISEERASLSIHRDGARQVLVTARRVGNRLTAFDRGGKGGPLSDDARSTLAVHLALHGWPLLGATSVREGDWDGEAVHPSGLASRIVRWEAWARANGWRVDTPRLPGLTYRSWEEIERL